MKSYIGSEVVALYDCHCTVAPSVVNQQLVLPPHYYSSSSAKANVKWTADDAARFGLGWGEKKSLRSFDLNNSKKESHLQTSSTRVQRCGKLFLHVWNFPPQCSQFRKVYVQFSERNRNNFTRLCTYILWLRLQYTYFQPILMITPLMCFTSVELQGKATCLLRVLMYRSSPQCR